jgi:hypothetical protein
LYREATEVIHKEVIKGTRWLLLKNFENLDPKKDEERLQVLLRDRGSSSMQSHS